MSDLLKYGKHWATCELVTQPFLGNTTSNWECNCGFSKAVGCKLCNGKGYVVELTLRTGGYLTGHCSNLGKT